MYQSSAYSLTGHCKITYRLIVNQISGSIIILSLVDICIGRTINDDIDIISAHIPHHSVSVGYIELIHISKQIIIMAPTRHIAHLRPQLAVSPCDQHFHSQ